MAFKRSGVRLPLSPPLGAQSNTGGCLCTVPGSLHPYHYRRRKAPKRKAPPRKRQGFFFCVDLVSGGAVCIEHTPVEAEQEPDALRHIR